MVADECEVMEMEIIKVSLILPYGIKGSFQVSLPKRMIYPSILHTAAAVGEFADSYQLVTSAN